LPAPVDQADWKAAVEGLIAAGEAANKAALTKNLDEMAMVSETLVNSCSACHDKYRDVDLEGGTRCQATAAK
jgi:cytochrome c556